MTTNSAAATLGQDTETVPIATLLPSDSPRISGESVEHAQALAACEAPLPPILVHRRSNRVIDGMHRLRAAAMRGESEIDVWFFDGPEDDAFVLAVETNIKHGLPLSLADRTAAAGRILRSHPEWSDRAIASATGLAAKTVGSIRRRSAEGIPQLQSRLGRDGRVRPLNSASGRERAGKFLVRNPQASLREVAQAAGISPGTARDVRERLRKGEDPVPAGQRDPGDWQAYAKVSAAVGRRVAASAPTSRRPGREHGSKLHMLRKDPSLRLSEPGRLMLRLLDICGLSARQRTQLVEFVPRHSAAMVADVARECAEAWLAFAEELDARIAGADRSGLAERPEPTERRDAV
ncbi:ParB/RepB/Spo0J family partition protein [Streptomyces decoyicus]|uniref:ParB/RepB/Spo0J family partition protein n=1 Tax=Streptomyces decoyicus TaxID=249567 RepID=UPI0033B3237F